MPKIQIADKPTLDKVYEAVGGFTLSELKSVKAPLDSATTGEKITMTTLDIKGKGRLVSFAADVYCEPYENALVKMTVDDKVAYHVQVGNSGGSDYSNHWLVGAYSTVFAERTIGGSGAHVTLWFPFANGTFHTYSSGSGFASYPAQLYPLELQAFEAGGAASSIYNNCVVRTLEPLRFNDSLKIEFTSKRQSTQKYAYATYCLDE